VSGEGLDLHRLFTVSCAIVALPKK